jgi:hypothetical protein
MWAIVDLMGWTALGDLDDVGQHLGFPDAELGEVSHRVSALVLQDAFVADGVDGDRVTAVDLQHRGRHRIGQPAPQRLVRAGRQVVATGHRPRPRLQNRPYRRLR